MFNKERKAGTEKPEKDQQKRAGRTGQAVRDRQNETG
jgi:hypothetical protein